MGLSRKRMRKRLVGVVAILAIIVSVSLVVFSRTKQSQSRGRGTAPKAAAELFSPMGSPFAKVWIEVYTPFDRTCPSCVLGAREVFKEILGRHKGKVRVQFFDADRLNLERKQRLARILESQGVPPLPFVEAWILVNGKIKFKVDGKEIS